MNRKLKQIIEENSLVRELYDKTQIRELSGQSDFEAWPIEWRQVYFKSYPRLPQIELGKPRKTSLRRNLSNILLHRSSNRDFIFSKISKEEISTLLFFSAGITKRVKDWNKASRFYPSAGARYPSEVYLIVFSSDDFAKGLYHYNVKTHSLELLLKEDLKKQVFKVIKQKWVKRASVLLIVTSVISRSEVKYNSRAYRFCLIEAGHLGQNIYLVSTALNLKCCAIGGFIDEDINSLLDFDDNNEFASYILAIGK